MLTTAEVAKQLNVTVRRVNDLINSGRLPSQKFGRAHMIKEADITKVMIRKPGRPRKGKG